MNPRVRPVPSGRCMVASLLVPVGLALLGNVGGTQALLTDSESSSASFRAASAGLPAVNPAAVTLYLRVGDGCVDSPLATITNTSRWPLSLAVEGTGWLDSPATVSASQSALGPGQSAVVSFTKWAVEGPVTIDGTVRVTASPGPFQTFIKVSGTVDNPAGAATPPYSLPPNCTSTPRPGPQETPVPDMTQVLGIPTDPLAVDDPAGHAPPVSDGESAVDVTTPVLVDDGPFLPDSSHNQNFNGHIRSTFGSPAPPATWPAQTDPGLRVPDERPLPPELPAGGRRCWKRARRRRLRRQRNRPRRQRNRPRRQRNRPRQSRQLPCQRPLESGGHGETGGATE